MYYVGKTNLSVCRSAGRVMLSRQRSRRVIQSPVRRPMTCGHCTRPFVTTPLTSACA